MRKAPYRTSARPAVALLLLLLPPFATPSEGEVLRYTVRADPLEIALTLSDGTSQTTRPGRETTHFYFIAENGWPVPEGPDAKRVRCEIQWNGFPAGWRLANSFGVDRRTQKFDTTLGDLRKAVFAGGDFRITTIQEGPLAGDTGDVEVPGCRGSGSSGPDCRRTAVWRDLGLAGHPRLPACDQMNRPMGG